ncbi:MAG: hypothetical protein IJ164_02730 [Duodenibacillus sp.]|nr:hypothetical protein [Duodenibacillus sp.]
MPKSRKPRKAYKPKPCGIPLGFRPERLEQIEDMFNNVETRVLMKIKEGLCDTDEMRAVRDVFNISLFAMTHRQRGFRDYPLEEISEQIIRAGIDTARVIERAGEIGRVVCTGDELGSILDTLQACVTFCREQLAQCPGIFVVEVNAAKLLTNTHQGRITVSKKQIDWTFDQAMAITHMRPDTQERLFADLTERARRLQIGQIVPAG